MAGGATRRPPRPNNVVRYLIRRLLAAVLLLIVVSMVTFAIFFLVPRLAGATPEDLASRYVGKTANQQALHQMAQKLGFYDPLYVQYGRFAKSIVHRQVNMPPRRRNAEYTPVPIYGQRMISRVTQIGAVFTNF